MKIGFRYGVRVLDKKQLYVYDVLEVGGREGFEEMKSCDDWLIFLKGIRF